MTYMPLRTVTIDLGNLRGQIFSRTEFAPSEPQAYSLAEQAQERHLSESRYGLTRYSRVSSCARIPTYYLQSDLSKPKTQSSFSNEIRSKERPARVSSATIHGYDMGTTYGKCSTTK